PINRAGPRNTSAGLEERSDDLPWEQLAPCPDARRPWSRHRQKVDSQLTDRLTKPALWHLSLPGPPSTSAKESAGLGWPLTTNDSRSSPASPATRAASPLNGAPCGANGLSGPSNRPPGAFRLMVALTSSLPGPPSRSTNMTASSTPVPFICPLKL